MDDSLKPTPQVAAGSNSETPPRQKGLLAHLTPPDWVILGFLLALFGPMFAEMVHLWTIPEAPQAYGLLVLPASVLLAWMLRSRLEGLTPQPAAKGLLLVGFGLCLLALGTLIVALTLSALGFVCVATGVVWTRYGREALRRLWFPLAFLLALVPFPSETLNVMTFPLQMLSVRLAGMLLRPFSEITIQGTQLTVSGYTVNVIGPCSGLTIVLPLFVLALFYLYMVTAPLWRKAILLALTFPVAMFVNALRVALIGLVGDAYGARVADEFHDYSGLITVILGFVALIFLAQELKCSHISEEIAL